MTPGSEADWRVSSYSSGASGTCVEIGQSSASRIVIRDTENRTGPVLALSRHAWQTFTRTLK